MPLLFWNQSKTGCLLVIEDHQQIGGLGEAVAALILKSSLKCRFTHLAVNNSFGQSARDPYDLYRLHGLSPPTLLVQLINYVTVKNLFSDYFASHQAIAAFNIDSFEIYQAVEAAVSETHLPCVVQLSPNEDKFITAEKLYLLVKSQSWKITNLLKPRPWPGFKSTDPNV